MPAGLKHRACGSWDQEQAAHAARWHRIWGPEILPRSAFLQNRLYLGEIAHKSNIYQGEHPAIATSKLRCLAQDTGGMLNVVAMDVTDAESVKNAATQLKDIAIDVLINSAGIAGLPGAPAIDPDVIGRGNAMA